jgi:hypothetical protein
LAVPGGFGALPAVSRSKNGNGTDTTNITGMMKYTTGAVKDSIPVVVTTGKVRGTGRVLAATPGEAIARGATPEASASERVVLLAAHEGHALRVEVHVAGDRLDGAFTSSRDEQSH